MQQQVILLACSNEANITAWDLNTGTQLTQYKHTSSARNCFCRLGSDYLIASQNNKDAIHFWTWHRDQVLQRSFTQEPLTALAASPNGAYIAAGGSSGNLYCWETATGRLLRTWPAHYKAVSCLRFSDSGGVLISGGDDTLVCAWLLAEVLDEQRDAPTAAAAMAAGSNRVEPLHTWSEHTLPITSLYVGFGENSALLVTASLDRTIKLWSLTTGLLLRTITLPVGITAVTLDAGEHVLLAGGSDGSIWEASLVGQDLKLPTAAAAGSSAAAAAASGGVVGGPGSCCYEGHTKAISSLAVTPDGELLVSGSEDGTARVWDLRSRQCLRFVKSPNKVPITTALLAPWPSYLAGHQSSGSGARQGPKRQQTLAPLAKFAGSSTSSTKPWEGPPIILDGRISSSTRPSTAPSLTIPLIPPAPSEPIDDLMSFLQTGAVGNIVRSSTSVSGNGIVSGSSAQTAAAEAAGGGDVAAQQDVASLQQTVQQLQQQLEETRRVAQQWQALHGELHQFCTDSVLASAKMAS